MQAVLEILRKEGLLWMRICRKQLKLCQNFEKWGKKIAVLQFLGDRESCVISDLFYFILYIYWWHYKSSFSLDLTK